MRKLCLAKAASVKNQISISSDFIEKHFAAKAQKNPIYRQGENLDAANPCFVLDVVFGVWHIFIFQKAGYPSRVQAAKAIPAREFGRSVPQTLLRFVLWRENPHVSVRAQAVKAIPA